jgi:rSAM/selenodomain-associated transferase 1
MPNTLIQLFAKAPIVGKVKTRLMADIGAEKALSIYLHCLDYNLSIIKQSRFEYQLWLNEASSHPMLVAEDIALQQGTDLGEKMFHAMNSVLDNADNNYNRVILIGSDCLEISTDILIQVNTELEYNELVLIPAKDGGYVLIAARDSINPVVFSRINWSTCEVLQQTLQRTRQAGLRTAVLKPLRDIDRVTDIQHYAALQNYL